MAQVVADKLQSFIAQIRSTALHHICNTARVSQEHPTDTASAGVRELVVSQQLQLADLQANVDVTKTTVGSVLSCLDELRSDLRWKALLEGMKSLPGSEFSGASTQWSVSKYMTCLARKQWLHPSTISHIEAYLLNSTQAAVLQTEASASRAAQQLLADEDRAAAIAAAKKAKKKQRQKARNQLTRNELVRKTMGSAASSQGGACNDEQHDAAFLQSLFCCPILKAAMVDPVIAADGHTYERVAIEQWLQHGDISPVTGNALAHTRLLPNVLIRKAIACQQQQP
ncbi:hypothetical protein WJX77_012463 [Trebouxia sp. C0004]